MIRAEWPIAVRMVNIGEALREIADVTPYPRTRVFVTDGSDLLGSVDIWNARRPITATRLRDTIAEWLAQAIARRALARGIQRRAGDDTVPLPDSVSVSIIVPTCHRPDDLRRCLASLCTQRTARRVEIVVVDNRPSIGTGRAIAREFPGVVVIDEQRPGLSYARNAGFAAATGDILVATDDNVVAPPDWIEKLVAPFARPDVMAVTGHVLPLELETESQCRFEAYGGLGKGFNRFEVDGYWFQSLGGAVPTWDLGATANAAFRATIFENPAIGLLDEALGAGMPTGCSEDTLLFYRILKAGHVIVYDPNAFVWHCHRRTMEALRHQIYSYSKGHVAYHLTTLFRERDRRALVRLGWSLPRTYLRRAIERLRRRSDYPLSLIALEILGNLAGAAALWQARRRVRRFGRSAPFLSASRRPSAAATADAREPRSGTTAREQNHGVSLESPLT
jgi:O-antigen biosynthesis protein